MTTAVARTMHLAAFCSTPGNHLASWRHARAATDRLLDMSYYQDFARLAEQGRFDMVFLADILALTDRRSPKYPSMITNSVPFRPEPLTVLAVMAGVTLHVGLAATLSTSHNEPYNLARRFAFLDHLSKGRAGWNIVTTASEPEAKNFSDGDIMPPDMRYDRAQEFIDVVKKLWDSWEDDALVINKAEGVYAEKDKVHRIDHKGKWFSVAGPLNVPRPPQGHPVLIQAGASDTGKDFAARSAEVIFLAAQTLGDARSFRSDFNARLRRFGRDPLDTRVLPGVLVFVGRTTEEAQEKQRHMASLLAPHVGTSLLSEMLDLDISEYPVDGPFPEFDLAQLSGIKSRYLLLKAMAQRENLTLGGVIDRVASGAGHRIVVGNPEQVADELAAWFTLGVVDGYAIMLPYLPDSLQDFVELVIPVLRRRGLVRTEYGGTTLREHLGLARPMRVETPELSGA